MEKYIHTQLLLLQIANQPVECVFVCVLADWQVGLVMSMLRRTRSKKVVRDVNCFGRVKKKVMMRSQQKNSVSSTLQVVKRRMCCNEAV